jgi:hypothetical protein
VLNQLTDWHLLFRKLLHINRDSNSITYAQVQLCLNKFDLELEQFMKASKKDCHKYKQTNIEWSPYSGEWLQQQWLLSRIQRYLSGLTSDPRNLVQDCRRCGVTDLRTITQEELRMDFFFVQAELGSPG